MKSKESRKKSLRNDSTKKQIRSELKTSEEILKSRRKQMHRKIGNQKQRNNLKQKNKAKKSCRGNKKRQTQTKINNKNRSKKRKS